MTGAGPGNLELAARQLHAHLVVDTSPLVEHRNRRTGAAATGERFADATLEHAQPDATTIDYLREADIDAIGEQRMRFDRRTEPLDRGGIDIFDLDDRVRIAHRHRAERDLVRIKHEHV